MKERHNTERKALQETIKEKRKQEREKQKQLKKEGINQKEGELREMKKAD